MEWNGGSAVIRRRMIGYDDGDGEVLKCDNVPMITST